MIDWGWISGTSTASLMVLLSGIGIYFVLLVLTRFTGLRSFSKMSSFDFAITVAIGSVVASTILAKSPSLLIGAVGLAVLYGIQYVVSTSRRMTETVERMVDNEPLLLMAGEEVISDHLDQARMTEDDLRSKLRMAGVTTPSEVLAVVFETTGDVSVLTTSDEVDPWIFEEVRGCGRIDFSQAKRQ
ncbi:hypothetical protein CRI94_16180 [Longibacter salinarum]|uniref:YetF C-terminal domain-containing protein n=1 Tax=Longibacter salinarum TaxID=1850348 RepID=A0A2A8CU87_9BACT|nr:YetF domain-containing protein [Longibacter salinarum]PEN11323.1 hypothetical protein CRI94_16180 [Longibacter salinarum]